MPHIHELYDFTVSFFIVHPREKKLCLHLHKNLGFWTQLGGHIELDEEPMQTIRRELIEEAGLHPEDYDIIETGKKPNLTDLPVMSAPFSILLFDYGKDSQHKHIDLPYIIKSKKVELSPQEGESTQIGWFDIEQMQAMRAQKILPTATYELCEWILGNFV
jgi:8-oxo-dGTP pyrophosphatase MutT (NUDIX family)